MPFYPDFEGTVYNGNMQSTTNAEQGGLTMDELKPCPFCGGEAHFDFSQDGNKTYVAKDGNIITTPFTYIVFCENGCVKTFPFEDSEMAIKAWNRRTE